MALLESDGGEFGVGQVVELWSEIVEALRVADAVDCGWHFFGLVLMSCQVGRECCFDVSCVYVRVCMCVVLTDVGHLGVVECFVWLVG